MKQGFFDIEKNIKERKGICVEVSEDCTGLIDVETGELKEFSKIFADFAGQEISFSIKVTTSEEEVAEIE